MNLREKIYEAVRKSGPIWEIEPVVDAVIAFVLQEAADLIDAQLDRSGKKLRGFDLGVQCGLEQAIDTITDRIVNNSPPAIAKSREPWSP